VDRPSFSLLGNLGFVPAGLASPALEISRFTRDTDALREWPGLAGWPVFRSGDAHRLDEISGALRLRVSDRTVAELNLAFRGCRADHSNGSLAAAAKRPRDTTAGSKPRLPRIVSEATYGNRDHRRGRGNGGPSGGGH